MECALCLQDRPLLRSHVIPEFLHDSVYDDNHRVQLHQYGSDRTKLLQKGLRVPLLCQDCEQHFSTIERRFSQFWYHPSPLPERLDGSTFVLSGVDYGLVKLFVLSIVWRASVARGDDFNEVSLGPHEERIRLMLLDLAAPSDAVYPVLPAILVDPDTRSLWDQVILAPVKMRMDRHWAVTMAFAGVAWTVVTSNHYMHPPAGPLLSDDGEMRCLVATAAEYAEATGLKEHLEMLSRRSPN